MAMDDQTDAELRTLRARAYGPEADIDGDAAARERLRVLEERLRRTDTTSVETEDAPSIPPASPSALDELFADGNEDAEDAESPRAAPDMPDAHGGFLERVRSTRPSVAVWALSLVLTAVVAAAIAYGASRLVPSPTAPGARVVATVGEGQRGEDDIARSWFGSDSDARSYTYAGLTILTTDEGYGAGEQACIVVVPAAGVNWEDRVINGQAYSGCSGGAFPATAQFTVEETAPSELRQMHPVGTSLQFVLLGDEISVLAVDGDAVTSAAL